MSPVADIGALAGASSLCIAAGRQRAIEIEIGFCRQQTAHAFVGNPQAIDLFEEPRAVGKKRHAAKLARRILFRAVHFPCLAVGLARHVGKRIQTVFRLERDFVDGFVAGTGALFVKNAGSVEIAVGRRVKLGGIAFERVRAELFNVDRDRRRQALRAQHVETHRRAVCIACAAASRTFRAPCCW